MIGRALQPGDDVLGAEPVAVLSYGLWQELGGSNDILGTRVEVDGEARTVVGVMPKPFWFPSPSERIWLARALDPEAQNGSYTFIGHVSSGNDPSNMTAQTAQLVEIIDERFDYPPDWNKLEGAVVTPLREELLGSVQPAIVATFVAMALILLIACTNVAALMLGQVERRGSELAVRAALGASRKRLAQPLVVEALLLGVAAAVAGSLVAAAGFGVLARALPIGAWSESVGFDWTLFAFALIAAIVAALLVVLIPATSMMRNEHRGDLHGALSRARTGGVGGGRGRLERGLIVVEVALAMLIASGATLLVRSVNNLYAIDPGIDTHGVALVDTYSTSTHTSAERKSRVNEVLEQVRALPGVASAAATMKPPLHGSGDSFGITIPGRAELGERTSSYFRVVTPGYFETLGFTLRQGRTFETTDQPTPGEVIIVVNQALVDEFFPGQDPIGKIVSGGFNVPQRIIGVVDNAAEANLTDERTAVRYYLDAQVAWFSPRASFLIRANNPGEEAALLDAARATVNKVAPDFAVQGTTTMSRVFDTAVGPARQLMALLALLSGLALLLGAIGIYGVISHFAQRRMRDWAIRVALGLPGRRVIMKIVGQNVGLVLLGVVVGAIGTVALGRLLTSFLYGVSPVDPIAFIGASSALLLAGAVAAFIPARRAGSVDPALVLREDA